MCNSPVTQIRFILLWDSLTLALQAIYSAAELMFRSSVRLPGNGCVCTVIVVKIDEGSIPNGLTSYSLRWLNRLGLSRGLVPRALVGVHLD